MPTGHSRGATFLCLVAVVLLAAAFRLQGFDHGLPYVLNPDEWLYLKRGVKVAIDLDPAWYNQSASTTHLVLGATYRALWAMDRLAGDTDPFDRWAVRERSGRRLIMAGRIACAVTDILTVLLVFVLVRRLGRGRQEALVASLLYASSAAAIGLSHIIRVDLQLILCFVACSIAAVDLRSRGRPADYALTGLFAGLAFATKWPAGMALLWLPLAHLLSRDERDGPRPALSPGATWLVAIAGLAAGSALLVAGGSLELAHIQRLGVRADKAIDNACVWFAAKNILALGLAVALAGFALPYVDRWNRIVASCVLDRRFWLGVASFAGGFVLGAPFAIRQWKLVVVGILCEARAFRPPLEGTPLENLSYYLTHPLASDLTLLGLALAAAGLVLIVRRAGPDEWLVGAVPALYFLYICAGPLHWDHYTAPLSPFLAVAAARSIESAARRIGTGLAARALVVLACLPIVANAWHLSSGFRLSFTGIEASRWLEARAAEKPGRPLRIVQDCHDAQFFKGNPQTTHIFTIAAIDPEFFTNDFFDYFVTSTTTSDEVLRREARYPADAARYRDLFARARPAREFSARDGVSRGPTVRIYELPPSARGRGRASRPDAR